MGRRLWKRNTPPGISGASGADARDLFTIVPASPTDLGDLPGGGQVIGDWLIVPTVEVTRSEGEDFRIRAQLDYDYEGQAYRFTTIEETITVFPAPELIIDYELPEADLVCTTFDLKATFRNVGAGPARNLRLTGGQPRVTRNTGNTPQSFKVTRVAVNGVEAANVTMALDIGDIPPGGFGEVVWRIEAEEAGRFVDFSSDYRMLNYLGEALAPSLRGINTTFAPPSDPFEYGCLTDAFSVSGYVRTENDTPIPGITVASASGRTAVTNADGYYILPGLVTGTYTIVPTRTGYTFLPETDAASVPPSVENLDFVGAAPPLTVEVLDPQGSLVTSLSANTEGWLTPNPVEVTVTINNTTGSELTDPTLILTIDSPLAEPRFYVLEEFGLGQGIYEDLNVQYKESVDLDDFAGTNGIAPGQTVVVPWRIWVQPSTTTTLSISAELYESIDLLGQAVAGVDIPEANIHPLVVLPGFLGTWPPEHGGKLDPLYHVYDNLIAALKRAGYELGPPTSGATLVPFGYDWRTQAGQTGKTDLANDIQAIQSVPINGQPKPYVNYDKVDIVAHSLGGLVTRAFIEHASANNEQSVHKFITLGTPHQGLPPAYRGWYGGDFAAFGISDKFQVATILTALAKCDGEPWLTNRYWQIANNPIQSFSYVRNHMQVGENLLPVPDVSPPYLVKNEPDPLDEPFPYPQLYPEYEERPQNDFLEDLNANVSASDVGEYDVDKLGDVPSIISSFIANRATEIQYRVDPRPTGSVPIYYWSHGEVVHPFIASDDGDEIIPAYSANITEISAINDLSNVQAIEENTIPDSNGSPFSISHLNFANEANMVRRIISRITGVDVITNERFWNAEMKEPDDTVTLATTLFACSPIRTLVTDTLGRRAGLDWDSGEIINEIPGAIVTEDGTEPHLIILPQSDGQYQVEALGIDYGAYKLGALQYIEATGEVVGNVLEGTTEPGQSHRFTFETSYYQEAGGQVVLEAEQFTWQESRSNRSWNTQTSLPGYVGSSYVAATPDTDLQFGNAYTTTSPELQYAINFTTTGAYYVWLRGYAPNGAGDSIYVSLDDQAPTSLTGFSPRMWTWSTQPADTPATAVTIDVSEAGLHTLRIWQREDGLRIDRIVITTDSSYNPVGDGPPESGRSNTLIE